jgi:Domain of unknown function (DUF4396)
MIPLWLNVLAIVSLISAIGAAVIIAVDIARRPQHMAVMNVVWPVTALYGGLLALWFYFRHGRAAAKAAMPQATKQAAPAATSNSFPVIVAIGDTHCGAGCTLGDIIAETLAFFYPTIAIWFGWRTIFAEKMFAVWIFDFILAFALGIMFQYFAIVPMRGLSFREGVLAALKADAISLTAWQVGMYICIAVAQFLIFGPLFGEMLRPDTVEFWFVMQIAMIAGFITSYPVNWWLIKAGVKVEM